jgi:hypothetical protein
MINLTVGITTEETYMHEMCLNKAGKHRIKTALKCLHTSGTIK